MVLSASRLTEAAPRVRRGTNLPRMGDFNQSVILDAIRRTPDGISRVELAAETRLSAQTISNICRRLLDVGLIREAGKEGQGPGKPRTLLRLAPEGQFAVGVHLDPAVITFVLLDLTGAVVRTRQERTPVMADPGDVVRAIVDSVTTLIDSSGVPRDRIAGIGVAAPGPMDTKRGVVVDPPNLAGWHRVELRDALHTATGLDVILDKDVTAAAVAEMWAGTSPDFENFLFVYLGTGIGVGTVMDGDVVRGTSGNAGEIGHIIVDEDGPLCFCGQRGCVAVTCTPRAIVLDAIAREVLPEPGLELTNDQVDKLFTTVCEAAAAGDAAARDVLDRSAVFISRAVAVVTNLMDIDHVVFGGPNWARLSPSYSTRIPTLLEGLSATREIHRTTVIPSGVGEGVGAVGAACLVLDRALTPRAGALLLAD